MFSQHQAEPGLVDAEDESVFAGFDADHEGLAPKVVELRAAARRNQRERVKELMANGVRSNWAVFGAAYGGHLALLNELLAMGGSIGAAVEGAAFADHRTLTNELIDREPSRDYGTYVRFRINDAVRGAAAGGHADLMNDMLERGAQFDDALAGATKGRQVKLVNDLKVRGASMSMVLHMFAFFAEDGVFEEEMWHFIAHIQDPELRQGLVTIAHQHYDSFRTRSIQQIDKILTLMGYGNELTFKQATHYLIKGASVTLFALQPLVRQNRLQFKDYRYIMTKVLDVSDVEVDAIVRVANERAQIRR